MGFSIHNRIMYLWQKEEWPGFTWKSEEIIGILARTARTEAALIGKIEASGQDAQKALATDAMTEEIVASSYIEGIVFDRSSVRSSILLHLGLKPEHTIPMHRNESQAAAILIDAISNRWDPLTEKRLFQWHSRIFSDNSYWIKESNIGAWRKESMYVISGSMGREIIHFEAPPAERIPLEIGRFLEYINNEQDADPILKAAIAHLWFVTIHPFADGNGRIARIIMEMMLARADAARHRYYSMSGEILKHKDRYYEILERTQQGSMDITEYLIWFLSTMQDAVAVSEASISHTLHKTRVWDKLHPLNLNDRQTMIVNMLIDGFTGKLTAEKWAKICKCSHATAVRDINEMIHLGILLKDSGKARNTAYELSQEFRI